MDITFYATFAVMNDFVLHTGGYRSLVAYRKTQVIYDLSFYFCNKYLSRGDRTIDQMVQAARSGKQNIIEATEAAITSSETLLKLLNVARASLHELLADYEDYLRVRNLKIWENGSPEVRSMQKLGREHDNSEYFLAIAQTRSDEVVANMAIVLIHQADVLLTRFIQYQYTHFVENGGFREHLTNARLKFRNNH